MGVQFAVLLAQADRPPAGAAAVYLLGIAMALMLPLHWRRAGLRQLAQVIFGTGLLVRTARLVVLYLEAAQTGAPGPNLAAISGNLAIVVLMLRVFASDDRLLGEGDLLIESTPQRRPTA